MQHREDIVMNRLWMIVKRFNTAEIPIHDFFGCSQDDRLEYFRDTDNV